VASITSDHRSAGLADPSLQPVEVSLPHEPAAAERGGGNGRGTGFLCREHVLAATLACFDEAGYDGTTIRAIAGRLGCAVGSIYRYYRDKRELLAACAAGMLEPVVQNMGAADAAFEQSVRRYVQTVDGRSELYRLMFWIGDGGGGLPLVVKRVIGGWARLLGDVAEARRRWAMLHGLLMLGGDAEKVIAEVCGAPVTARSVPQGHAPRAAQPPAASAETAAPAPAGDDITLL